MVEGKLWTVKDLARELNMHPATVTRALVAGSIRGIRPTMGKKRAGPWRITQAEYDRLTTQTVVADGR